VAHYQGLLGRNPALEAGLIFLKDAASLRVNSAKRWIIGNRRRLAALGL
jgi:hypothetical protein